MAGTPLIGPGGGRTAGLLEVQPATGSHHALAAHEVVLLLGTDIAQGLADTDATDRLHRFGRNELPQATAGGPIGRFVRQLRHPLVYVLLAAGAVTLGMGEAVDAGVIFGVVLVNAVVGTLQESRAEAALDALRRLVRTETRVRRDGRRRTVESAEVVPGDVVLLEAGDKVPADARLVKETGLEVDESALTGESEPVAKDEVVLPVPTPVADRRNMVYSGTLVTHGTGVGVVVATGAETEVGQIHRLVGTAEDLMTPLTRKLTRFSKVLTVAILGLAGVTFLVGLARGEAVADMLRAAVALAVGAIPEGLPAAVTITLAIGVARMARRRAVVRRMPAVETLGSTTVVCSDKTGTLTENQMTVSAIWTPEETFDVAGIGYRPEGVVADRDGVPAALERHPALRWTAVIGAICNDARFASPAEGEGLMGDPTEGALLVAASKAGLDPVAEQHRRPRLATVPFSSQRRLMLTLHRDGTDRLVAVKGAVEDVLGLCAWQLRADGSLAPLDPGRAVQAAETMAHRGLRVLATAMGRAGHDHEEAPLEPQRFRGTLALTGLVGMLDPPRPEAVAAIRACHTAGIDVKMITGDHAATALAVARELGVVPDGSADAVLTGKDLAELDLADDPSAVERADVFARVSPEQKLHLVRALQAKGEIVAMTGDGVNDAPALRQADIGVALGKSGTEVAKDAADMVLTDDNFSSIEAAIEEGRGVFDNLTKFLAWTLPTNVGEGLVILVAIVLGTTLPLLPVQILWINMTTAVGLGLMLSFEPKEGGIMRRPPRDPRRPLLDAALLIRIALISALLVVAATWVFHWELSSGGSAAEARTGALNVFVAGEAVYLIACRSLTRSVWQVGVFSNRWIAVGLLAQAAGQAAITYVPAMNSLFATAPIGTGTWVRICVVAVGVAVAVGADKRVRRHLARRGGSA